MADIMMKMQLDKMATIILIWDVFGHLNIQIDAVLSSASIGVIGFTFKHKITKVLSTKVTQLSKLHFSTSADWFSPITFKLDVGQTF